MIPGLKKRVFNLHDVMMYVAIARKHGRLMLLLVCLSALAGMVYYIYARPVYYSRSLIRADFLAPPPGVVDTETLYHDSRLSIIIPQLQAPHIVERTAKQLGINETSKDIFRNYVKKISVRVNSQRNLEVEVWPYVSSWSSKWTEIMVREFLKAREEQRIQSAEKAVKAYNERMEELGRRIDEGLDSKSDFRAQQNLTRAEIDLNRIRYVPRELVSTKQRLAKMESVRTNLQDPNLDPIARLSLIASVDKEMPVTLGQQVMVNDKESDSGNQEKDNNNNSSVVVLPQVVDASHPWEDKEKDLRRIQSEIADASRVYLPGHRKMMALRKELEGVNKQLELDYDVAKNRFDLEYQNVLNKMHELEAKLPEYQKITSNFQRIQQASKLNEASKLAWDRMFKELAQAVTTYDYVGSDTDKERVNLEYLSLLESRDTPVSPSRGRLIMLSLLFGVVLSIGVPFLIEYLDHTISSFEQVETTFQMRGLGIIPKIAGGDVERPVLLDVDGADDRNLVENFRVIRTNLLSIGALTKPPHVIMTTSAMPKEGKTVVSSNLAISFAQTGAKTLIIDADLRRGRLHRLFGLRKGPGLSNVLLERTTMEEALRPTGKENLTILTAGQHLETGTELLGSEKFTSLMAEFRSRYDRIIVDTPPVLGLSETSILQNHVDGVLFVVWSGRTPISNMKTAIEILQSNGANFYGFVLNRLDLSATTNYYQYYYYSNDYYHSYHALENA